MEKLEEKIYTAIGTASMCWSEVPKGVFDEALANKIAKELINDIHGQYDPLKAVTQQIKNDPELFYAWQSNIAMQFKDLVKYNSFIDGQPITALDPALVHNLANQAAINFLNLLCNNEPEKIVDLPHISGE